MSGGQVFAATGGDADRAIATALDATRAPHQPSQPVGATPTRVETTRRGARLVATWGEKVEGEASVAARRVGAMAAMLAIPLMPEDAATKLAEAEGIVCHLTSLVLVDEAGARQEGIPASRKVALSAPRTAAHAASPVSMLFCLGPMDVASPRSLRSFHIGGAPQARQADDIPPLAPSLGSAPEPASGGAIPSVDLGHLVRRIDWDADPEALRRGDLAQLSPKLVSAIHAAAKSPEIVAFATALGIDPVIVVIALLARAAGKSNRSAQRIARGILGRSQANEIGAVMTEVGL
jgi:hypothetical protein